MCSCFCLVKLVGGPLLFQEVRDGVFRHGDEPGVCSSAVADSSATDDQLVRRVSSPTSRPLSVDVKASSGVALPGPVGMVSSPTDFGSRLEALWRIFTDHWLKVHSSSSSSGYSAQMC